MSYTAAINVLTPINIFVVSMFVVAWSGPWLVAALTRISRYLGWREFVVAFFLMAFAGSLPNLAVGITSALQGIPELSFGDVVGGNMIDLSLAVALAVLLSGAALSAEGITVQSSVLFSVGATLLPLVLILDGNLSRIDGIIMIAVFLMYMAWLFSKGERFKKVYDNTQQEQEEEQGPVGEFRDFMRDLGEVVLGGFLLVAGADGVVWSASNFAQAFEIPLAVVGIVLVGLGNALPEIYFAISSARQGKTEMILGDLMGSVMVPATLVLGLVVLIRPIEGIDLSPFTIGRFFLVLSAVIFFIAARTGRKITRKEGWVLFGIYILFILVEIFTR